MQITFFSLFMSVIWSSFLVIFNHFCRKKHFFIRQLGITNILFLYLFSVIRMMIPYEFSFTRVIPPQDVLNNLFWDISINKPAMQISIFFVLAAIWGAISAILIVCFVLKYVRAMRKFSTYNIRKDAQCCHIFNRVLNVSKTQMKIAIRSSSDINIPISVGIFRKSIILPDQDYSDSELYYILLHEYTHFQNKDLIIKILINIYGCIFWWNPAIYLLKKDLSQILEIKCDLDVTDNMANKNKAEYLATIVTMLRNAGAKKREKAFYGTTALVSRDYDSEIIERFQLVSAGYGYNKKNVLVTGSWFFIFSLFIFLSYSFVIRPDYGTSMPGAGMNPGVSKPAGNSYFIECVDDIYYVHFQEQ